MNYKIRKNWVASFDLMATKPIVIMPFIFVAFLEGLALELIYYFPRKPLANIAAPVMRRFFGEVFLHYPDNLVILPKLFYYAQVLIYVFCGVFLAGICVNIARNIRMGLALQADTLAKYAFKRYLSFFGFGIIVSSLMFLLNKVDAFIFVKVMDLVSEELPEILLRLAPFIFTLFLFCSNIVLQTFLVLTVPLLVIKKKSLLKALICSISLGLRNFGSIFTLIFLPFLIYLPIALLKVGSSKLVEKTFPEINLYIIIVGIILAVFVECFVVVCASQFLWDQTRPQLIER